MALCFLSKPFTPKHQYAYSPYCSPYISKGDDKEKLLKKSRALVADHFLYSRDLDE